jgi:hypothetical protein
MLVVVLLLCFGSAVIGLAPGISHRLAAVLGFSRSETPTTTKSPTKPPKQSVTPAASPSVTPMADSATPEPEVSSTVAMTVTPTTTGTPTALPSDTPDMLFTGTVTLTDTTPVIAQTASIKKSVQLRDYPNGQYLPAANAPTYAPGEKVVILKIYSFADVDWFFVRTSDNLEGWLKGNELNLKGFIRDNILVVEEIVFPTLTSTPNP